MILFENVAPKKQSIESITKIATLKPFSPVVVDFISELSREILNSRKFRKHPEMIAFAYWMRVARLKYLHQEFEKKTNTGILAARGLIFHIAPSNVDSIFLYSILLSMLIGNTNIVRVSSRDSKQIVEILELFNVLFENKKYEDVRNRLAIVRYGHDEEVTKYFSNICDVRVIWGGDNTINTIRAISISPNATEICFADKTSLGIFDAKKYSLLDEKDEFIKRFINDSFWFAQMACSSPRLIIWRGEYDEILPAKKDFWLRVETRLQADLPDLSNMDFLNKLVFEQCVAIKGKAHIRASKNNYMNVVQIDNLKNISIEEHCGGGIFLEAHIGELNELSAFFTKRYQTIASLGIEKEEWLDFLEKKQPKGIDRIVPIGEALTFSPIWDGFDIMREFSREISLLV